MYLREKLNTAAATIGNYSVMRRKQFGNLIVTLTGPVADIVYK